LIRQAAPLSLFGILVAIARRQRELIMKLLLSAFITLNVWLYRMSGGRVMGKMGAAPILLLTTTGRKSGRTRTVPLLYLKEDGGYVIVASLGGAPRHPVWYLNLEANPKVELRVGSQRFAGEARRASAEEKARLWPRLVAIYPQYADYQKRTTRDIPVVIVSPV
jgi:deazaflavin-dependent oxidoreductase (nitroreductase family)